MRPVLLTIAIGVLLGATWGCGGGVATPSDGGPLIGGSGSTTTATADLVFCVDETNRYRALRNKAALARSTALEAYAADGARVDALAGAAHRHFDTTSGGGVATAENEALRLNAAQFASTRDAITAALYLFYGEGPGGGDYDNMLGDYTQIGCGVYRSSTEITIVQDFR